MEMLQLFFTFISLTITKLPSVVTIYYTISCLSLILNLRGLDRYETLQI